MTDKPHEPAATRVDEYKPDYKHACEVCGQKPTVTAVSKGKVVLRTGMCGPCTWGEAETIDPSTW